MGAELPEPGGVPPPPVAGGTVMAYRVSLSGDHTSPRGASTSSVTVPASDGQKIAWLHAHGEVLGDEDAGEGDEGPLRRIEVRLTPREIGRFAAL